MPQQERGEAQAVIWGDYVVPALAGVKGCIEFAGPKARAYVRIDGETVEVSPEPTCNPDCVITSDIEGELVRLVSGEANLVTAVLQGRVEASGDLMLAVKIAGSMPALGRQQSVTAEGGA